MPYDGIVAYRSRSFVVRGMGGVREWKVISKGEGESLIN